ncbi:MAG: ABC transporter substrate-binding protein [Anaerolineales bacterium]|nr:ABC transporter substrate-binding protein [Anaerolineales bacterium]
MRLRLPKPWWTVLAVLVTAAFVVAACAPAAAPKPTIKLAANPWDGSRANVAVAKILLEKELGYTVEIVDIDENAQFPALAKGDLSATLEIWPSGHAKDYDEYITTGKLEDLGPLGVVGKIGWFIPTYLLKDHPELATWEGFQDPATAALFQTAETGDAGQFIGGDPSFVQYDEALIKNLGLNLKVVFAGSEQAELAALDAAYAKQEPFLFYFWTPHAAHAQYDLTNVKLPTYSAECEAKGADARDCDYPEDVLYKAGWAGLKDAAPEAHALLKAMSYTNKDQITIMADIAGGKSVDEAAQAWVDANKATWEKWLGR